MLRRTLRTGRLAPLALLLFLAGCATGATGFSASVDRESDDHEEAGPLGDSPDAMADVLGEPDEWRHEGQGSQLQVVMIWHCLDGHRREAIWRRRDGGDGGRSYWSLVKDETSRGDCN